LQHANLQTVQFLHIDLLDLCNRGVAEFFDFIDFVYVAESSVVFLHVSIERA
jgi:hypothetical protein